MYLNDTIRKYVDDASSSRPMPGGGSIAALCGALGVSMGCMAANFTIGKKKFKDVEPQVKSLLAQLEEAREALLSLMDEDTRAYAQVGAAFSLPRATEAQKQAREAAVQQALKAAMQAPLHIMRQCRAALDALTKLVDLANPNLISDVGVAAILGEAACRAAKLNVDINLRVLEDEARCAATRDEMDTLLATTTAHAEVVQEKVNLAVNG